MNLAAHLARNAQRDPSGAALGIGTSVVSDWAAMARDVSRLAGGLRALGLEPGARVAIVAGNSPDYARAMYAIWWAGLAAVPVNVKLHPKELAYCLEHSGAALILHSDDLASNVAATGTGIRAIGFGGADWRKLHGEEIVLADTAPGDLAWLFYTSGTTGRPKGAMLTHRNLLAMATSYFVDVDPPQSGGSIVHAAPMSHGSGIYAIPTLAIGAAQMIPESGGFDPAELFELWRRWNHVTMFAAPTMVKRLTEARDAAPGNLRVAVFGGAPMYVADLKAAIGVFGYRFAQLYGQGESPMCITAMTRATIEAAHKAGDDAILGSVGTAQSVVRVRCASDGEVLVRGDSVMKGYWRDEAATAKALREGWLHTGDVGEFDARGYLTLKDRSKDLIISGGSNIYPREVEEVLQTHPEIAEVSVIGEPDPEWGENVVAFVARRAGCAVDAKTLDALCLANIARFKRPKRYVFVDALPKSAYGKILKTELRKKLTEK